LRFVWKFDLSDVRLPGAEKRRAFLFPIILIFPIIGLRPQDKNSLQTVWHPMRRRDAALEPTGETVTLLLRGGTLASCENVVARI